MPSTNLNKAYKALGQSSSPLLQLRTAPPRLGESISSVLDRAGSLWNLSRSPLIREITGMSPGDFGDPDWIPNAQARCSLALALNVTSNHLAQFAAAPGRTSLLMAPPARHAYCPLCFACDRSTGKVPGFQLDWGRFWLTHCRIHLTPLFDWRATGPGGERWLPPEWLVGKSSFRPAPRSWLKHHLKRARWYARIGPRHGEVYEQWKALLMFETALYCTGIGGPKGSPCEEDQPYEEILSQLMTLFLIKPRNLRHPLPALKLDPQFYDPDVFDLPASMLAPHHTLTTISSLRSKLSSIAERRALILLVANVIGAVDHPLCFTYVRPSPSPGSEAWSDILLSLIRNRDRAAKILAKVDAYRQPATSSGWLRAAVTRSTVNVRAGDVVKPEN